jgi:phenylacetate-CoA ligase
MAGLATTFELAQREISYAYENVGFFRKHMDRSGVLPADISQPVDMLRLPPTRKADYRRGFPADVIASGYNLRSRHVMRFQSSGTAGERLVSVVHSYDLARRQATCLEFNPRFAALWEPGLRLRTCRYTAPNCSDVECSNPNSTMESRLLADRTLVLPVYHDLLATPPQMTNRALDEIAAYDPHHLFVDPTHFAFLIRAMRTAGRQVHTRPGLCISSGYTLCTRIARRQIRECYGPDVPFADMLGMSELGYLGFECPIGCLHINSTDYYVEFIRDGRPADCGELAELVVTTLEDRLAPHVRYATGDLYRVQAQPCACGSAAPVVLAEGRATNMLWRRDGTLLTPRELDELVGPAPWMDLYRMVQLNDDEFAFQFLPNESFTSQDEHEVAERLRDALGTRSLECSAANYLPSDRGGKFLSCVSAVAARHGHRG